MKWMAALSLAATAFAAEEAPSWLKELAAISVPPQDAKVPAITLLDEESVVVDPSGKLVRTRRFATRVLTLEGKESAFAFQGYSLKTAKVRSFDAWLIPPAGAVIRYGKKEIVDSTLTSFELYSEYRARSVNAQQDARPGSVFGYEAVVEEKPLMAEDRFDFQGQNPVLTARYKLTLPPGWETRAVTFNHAPITPGVEATTTTWELTNLPFIDREEDAPRLSAIAPRMYVTYFGGPAEAGKAFKDWRDVSLWMDTFRTDRATVTPEIESKARQLTAHAASSSEKIEAIAEFVQGIRYVAISTDVGAGGGYRPFPASEVLAKSYGDCKDKANLMSALLAVLGIRSWTVSIFSGDRTFVRAELPSPRQFNHAIIAVEAPPSMENSAIFKHPALGRLLIFDPTDPSIRLGWLPAHEQDSWAMLDGVGDTPLFRVPAAAPAANKVIRRVEAQIGEAGEMKATVNDQYFGEAAAKAFGQKSRFNPDDYRKMHDRVVNRSSNAAVLQAFDSKGDGRRFEAEWKIDCARCGQTMQNRLLTFKPVVLRNGSLPNLAKTRRLHPVVLDAEALEETVRVKLPAGFKIDELPDPFTASTRYGEIQATWKQDGADLLFERKMEIRAMTVPVSEYSELRKFIGNAIGVEAAPVVLLRTK